LAEAELVSSDVHLAAGAGTEDGCSTRKSTAVVMVVVEVARSGGELDRVARSLPFSDI